MTTNIVKTKKTFYIESDLVTLVKIKSAIDGTTETDAVNFILSEYFNGSGEKYSFLRKEK